MTGKKYKKERTVVLIKPDAVKRGIVGDIIGRIERNGLKMVAMKMLKVNESVVARHYPRDRKYLTLLGNKVINIYKEYGEDPGEDMGTKDAYTIGKMVQKWSIDYVSSGPIVAILIEGDHAIKAIRRLVGNTMPISALAGTIRGDFGVDSAVVANKYKRGVKNVIHASGDPKEAKNEEELWFKKKDIISYKRYDEVGMY